MSFTFPILLLSTSPSNSRINSARKYGISGTRTGRNKKSTGRRHAHVELLFPYKGVSSQTRMSTHDRAWADVENQLRANFGTEEGEQDGETVGLASRKIEKRSTMTFEGRRRSCLSLLRAFSAKILAGRHARHLWNVLWHEKMLGEAWKSHVFILPRNFEEFVDVSWKGKFLFLSWFGLNCHFFFGLEVK